MIGKHQSCKSKQAWQSLSFPVHISNNNFNLLFTNKDSCQNLLLEINKSQNLQPYYIQKCFVHNGYA